MPMKTKGRADYIHFLVKNAKGSVAPTQLGPLCGWLQGDDKIYGSETKTEVDCPVCLDILMKMKATNAAGTGV